MGGWTRCTVLGENYKTTIFAFYRARTSKVNPTRPWTIISQQQRIFYEQDRDKEHLHDATIEDLIITANKLLMIKHVVFITMNGDEKFSSVLGRISKLCKTYQLVDP